jgi:hypothetical protein
MADDNIRVYVDDASAVKGFRDVLARSRPAAAELLNDVADWGRDYASELAQVDRGALSEMIFVDYASHEKLEAAIISDQEYSATIEAGSKPHWPPAHSLEMWGKYEEYKESEGIKDTKGITDEAGGIMDEEAGRDDDFLLRRYISIHGTRAYPFMGPTAKKIPSALAEFAKYFLADLKSGGKYVKSRGGKAAGIAKTKSLLSERYRKSMPTLRKRPPDHTGSFLNPRTGKWESARPGRLGTTSKKYGNHQPQAPKKVVKSHAPKIKTKSNWATKGTLTSSTYRPRDTKRRRKL